MILAIDVGNTNIIIGVIDAKKTYFVERITTTIGKPNLEYAVALKSILEIYHIAPDQLDGAIVSSVVPPLNRTILAAIRKITGLNAMLVGSEDPRLSPDARRCRHQDRNEHPDGQPEIRRQ